MYSPNYSGSKAIVIGINRYEKLNPLSYAIADAVAVSDALVSLLGFPIGNVTVLTDDDATKNNIMRDYLGLVNSCDVNDRVVFFFAGHGITKESLSGPIGYLSPYDADPKDLGTLIRWDDFTRNADLIPAKHILYVIDACYGGLVFKRVSPPAGTQRFLTDVLQRVSRQVIAAGKADQTVSDGGGTGGKNSVFTSHLVDGLKGKALEGNKILTASMLMHYVYTNVSQDTSSSQTPHYGHFFGDGDVVLIAPDLEGNETDLSDALISVPANPGSENVERFQPVVKHDFPSEIGYSDPKSANFGRNDLSQNLVEQRGGRESISSYERAFSWFTAIAQPSSPAGNGIDISRLYKELSIRNISAVNPYERFLLPNRSYTTLDSLVLYDFVHPNENQWITFIRITGSGNFEYSDTAFSFQEWNGNRLFSYVQIVGMFWQFIFFVRHVLGRFDLNPGISLHFNLVGTQDSYLDDFSEEKGEGNQFWKQPFSAGYDSMRIGRGMKCSDKNILLSYKIPLSTLDEASSKEIINDVASKLGLAFNHRSSPRCFNFNTEIFPWQQYVRRHN